MTGTLRLRIRLMAGRSIALGPGKADLLSAIMNSGSISAAARELGMSYKRAWYLIDTMNQCFAGPVVDAAKGGNARGGALLTPLGREVLAHYRSIEDHAAAAIADDLNRLEALLAGNDPAAGE